MEVAIYVLNRLPNVVLQGHIPYEIFLKTPSVDHLKLLGFLCYATKLIKLDKFDAKVSPTIIIGYSSTQNGYKLLNCSTKKFFTCRDIIFKEHLFLFSPPDSKTSHDRGSTPLDHVDIVMNGCDQQHGHGMHKATEYEMQVDGSDNVEVQVDTSDNAEVNGATYVKTTREVENEVVYEYVAHIETVLKEDSASAPRKSIRTKRNMICKLC